MKELIAIAIFCIIFTMALVYFWPKTCLIQRAGIETFADVPTVDSCPAGTYSYVTLTGNTQCCSTQPNGTKCEGKVVCTMNGEGNTGMPKCSDLIGSTSFQSKNQPIGVEGSAGDFCLTSENLLLQKCKKGYPASQRFTYTSEKQIMNQGSGKCLKMNDYGVFLVGEFVKCDKKKDQQFLYNYKSKTLQSMMYPQIDLSMAIPKKSKEGYIVYNRPEEEYRILLNEESKKSTRKIDIENEIKNYRDFMKYIQANFTIETGKFDILPETKTNIADVAKKFGVRM